MTTTEKTPNSGPKTTGEPRHTRPQTASERYAKKRKTSKKPLIFALLIVAAIAAGAAFILPNIGKTGQNHDAHAKRDQITIGLNLEPKNLDIRKTAGVALSQILIDNVYQGLIGLKSGKIDEYEPVLATEMPQISTDGRTYTFKLRENVKFHDGSDFTSEDFLENKAPLEKALNRKIEIDASQPHALRLTLDQPHSQTLWHLADKPGLVLNKGAQNDLANSANGTGPYRLAGWAQKTSITLEKSENYWGQPASTKTVTFQFFKEPQAYINALREGSLDVQTVIAPANRKELENQPGITLHRAGGTDVFTLAYNSASPKLADKRVREALSRAVDTGAIIKSLEGDGKPLGGPITAGEPGFTDLTGINAYDPAAAKKLLAEAGFAGGAVTGGSGNSGSGGGNALELTLTVPSIYPQAISDILVSQYKAVGVKLNVERVEFSVWLDRVYKQKNYELSLVNHAEARDFGNYANPQYYFNYNSEKVQKIYAESLATADTGKAAKLLLDASREVAADAPAKWLYNYTPTIAVSKKVHGFPQANTSARLKLAGVTVDK
ncbi:MAG: ABC transporter substrate-binding protein [Microbacteriaceae bacterium]|nr:ABC transporter substrate-binding protein [Microbacteriaceae bacterium]